MESFYVIVLVVAVIVLVIVLAIFGVMMQHQNNQTVYPPTSNRCPDYWTYDTSGKCTPPTNKTNLGLYRDRDTTKELDPNLPPYSISPTFDPSNNQWSLSGKSVVCAQRDWATQNEIVWDGVSNYNNC
jgi:hypothetical protein